MKKTTDKCFPLKSFIYRVSKYFQQIRVNGNYNKKHIPLKKFFAHDSLNDFCSVDLPLLWLANTPPNPFKAELEDIETMSFTVYLLLLS